MKRCPECDFVYLDTDEVCDLDGTPLVHADDLELVDSKRAEPQPTVRPNLGSKAPRSLFLAAISVLVLGVLVFVVYLSGSRRGQTLQPAVAEATPSPQTQPESTIQTSGFPSPQVMESPVAKTAASPSVESNRTATSHKPVSTSSADADKSAEVTIQLTNGARIEADEVWRTKEGVWYRKSGVVTLIKANRVKTIQKRARK